MTQTRACSKITASGLTISSARKPSVVGMLIG